MNESIHARVNELRAAGTSSMKICDTIRAEMGVQLRPNQLTKYFTDETRAAFEQLVRADRAAGVKATVLQRKYGVAAREIARICIGVQVEKPRRKPFAQLMPARSSDGHYAEVSEGAIIAIQLPDRTIRKFLITRLVKPHGADLIAYCLSYEYGLEVAFVLALERFRVVTILDTETAAVEAQKLRDLDRRMQRLG